MDICPYFKGDQKQGKKFQIRCVRKDGHAGNDFTLSYDDEEKFKSQLKVCSTGEGREGCRPFLYRQLEELGGHPSSEMNNERLRELYLEKKQEAEKSMENEKKDVEVIGGEKLDPQYRKACKITQQIRANASVAAESMVEVCRGLKQMRDEKLFEDLGYQSFDAYTEDGLNIKGRQAYNYISAYERLGPTVLQSNADLGITKLVLLAEAPATERDGLLESNDIAGMSTREVEELVKKVQDQGEQLSLLTDERDKLKSDYDADGEKAETLREEKAALTEKLFELGEKLHQAQEDAKNAKPDEDTILKAKQAAVDKARKEADKQAREQQKFAVERAKREARQDAEKEISAARVEGEKAGREAVADSLKAVEQEKAAALERATKLEKELAVAGDKNTVIVLHLSEELQTVFRKLMDTINGMDDSETAAKFKAATGKLIDALKGQMEAKS